MLLGLLIQDMVAVKIQVYVFALRHLHTVAVIDDTELFVAALYSIGLDFLWCLDRKSVV